MDEYERAHARAAAAQAAAELVESGMTIGLGSGRMVWTVVEILGARRIRPRVVAASRRTALLAHRVGMEVVEIGGDFNLDLELVVDGADEVDRQARAIKGGGGALLPEKLLASATQQFVIAVEPHRLVERLGETAPLPVEVVRFAWPLTRQRLGALLPSGELRTRYGQPVVTEHGNYIIDCELPAEIDLDSLDRNLKLTRGVVEHGLFVGMVDLVLVGRPDGHVDALDRSSARNR